MNILICGEIYSENLGDGVIAASNKYLLDSENQKISYLDLSGRNNFQKQDKITKKNYRYLREINKKLMTNKYYSLLMFLIFMKIKGKKDLRKYYTEKILTSDFLIIGGGQLLMDNNLSFPYRINLLTEVAEELNIPYIFDSIGVSDNWSDSARLMFKKSFERKNFKGVSTRDIKSKKRLTQYLKISEKNIDLAVDPAIFADEAYNIKKSISSKTIGIGITNFNSLIFGSNNKMNMTENELLEMWQKLIYELLKREFCVELFTNGSIEDQEFAQRIKDLILNEYNLEVKLLARPLIPKELVEIISGFKLIVAHRLHANIISYSLKIPSIGLGWDEKVIEFGKLTNRERYYIDKDKVNSNEILNLILERIQEVSMKDYQELKLEKKILLNKYLEKNK